MPKGPPTTPRLARIQTLADLLRDAYGSKRKRLVLSKADLKAIRSAPRLEAEQREELLRLAATDRTLERTRELLLVTIERLAHDALSRQVKEFVREVMQRHPAYQSPRLHGVIENLPEAVSISDAVEALAVQPYDQRHWPPGSPPLKKSEAQAMRLAAVHCLLLWVRETRVVSLEQIQRLLQAACWAPEAGRKRNSEGQILRILMLARDRVALGTVCLMLEARLKEKARDADAARAAEQRASARCDRLQSDLEEANTQLESERSRNMSLHEQIERERREHQDEKAHMRNDYEELRGRTLHRLRQEVTILDEGLHALKKQPPKVHVMEDHAERAIDGLKSEIERIKGEGD